MGRRRNAGRPRRPQSLAVLGGDYGYRLVKIGLVGKQFVVVALGQSTATFGRNRINRLSRLVVVGLEIVNQIGLNGPPSPTQGADLIGTTGGETKAEGGLVSGVTGKVEAGAFTGSFQAIERVAREAALG